MICPRCGSPNADSAPECAKCFYKFRPSYGYEDPGKASPLTSFWLFRSAAEQTGPGGLAIRIVIVLIVVAFLLMLVAPVLKGALG